VYVLGGTEGIAPLDQVESFDALTGTWTLEPPLPFSRCAVAPHRPASGGLPPFVLIGHAASFTPY
jgi:hypothetical protein